MKETFAGKVRAAAKKLQQENHQVTFSELAGACAVRTRKKLDLLHQTLLDFCTREEMCRLKPGVFLYTGRTKPTEKEQIMWRYLRSGRSFGGVTVNELREVAGVCEGYAFEWLGALVERGLVNQIQGRWQLTADVIEMPKNDAKSERLRNIRAAKRNLQSEAQAV